MWPGFGENLRVLEWVLGRCSGQAEAVDAAVGKLPAEGAINLSGLAERPAMEELLKIDAKEWREEVAAVESHLEEFGGRVPKKLHDSLDRKSEERRVGKKSRHTSIRK